MLQWRTLAYVAHGCDALFSLAAVGLQGRLGSRDEAPELPAGPNRKNMLETVASHRIPPSRSAEPPPARYHTAKTQSGLKLLVGS
jgi:hypothetical protein